MFKSFKQFITESNNTLNSEGREIYSSPEGIANFWKWFGRSKVIDNQGRPLVVYHTSVADINRFKRNPLDIGMHFGTHGQAADRYHLKISKNSYGPEIGSVRHNTIPVYLKIENPVRLPDCGKWNVYWLHREMGKIPEYKEVLTLNSIFAIQKFIKSKGYDGIVYSNIGEAAGADRLREKTDKAWIKLSLAFPNMKRMDPNAFDDTSKQDPLMKDYLDAWNDLRDFRKNNAEDSYIVFDSKQIKSALGNNGNFKSTSPIITESE